MKSLHLLAAALFVMTTLAVAEPPPAGVAKGTCAKDAEPAVTLAYATAFTDEKDDRKPTVIILSDVKLPAEKWTSEFDLMRSSVKFSGAIFFLDKENAVYRNDFYWKGQQSSVSGYYTLALDPVKGKDFTGTITSDKGDAKDPKVDATFHATLK